MKLTLLAGVPAGRGPARPLPGRGPDLSVRWVARARQGAGGSVSEVAGASAAAVVVPRHVPTETPAGRRAPGLVQVAGLGLPRPRPAGAAGPG